MLAEWTPVTGGFVTEISDLPHSNGSFSCPKCEKRLWMHYFRVITDREDEVTGWGCICQGCDSNLTIFND